MKFLVAMAVLATTLVLAPVSAGAQLGPIANEDQAEVAPGGTVTIDVLANDLPGDRAGQLTVVEVSTPPTVGTATVSRDAATIAYSAPSSFAGASFEYEMSDGTATARATVTVTAACGDVVVTAGEGGAGLEAAIVATNGCPGPQVITLDPGSYEMSELAEKIVDDVTIRGLDPDRRAEILSPPVGGPTTSMRVDQRAEVRFEQIDFVAAGGAVTHLHISDASVALSDVSIVGQDPPAPADAPAIDVVTSQLDIENSTIEFSDGPGVRTSAGSTLSADGLTIRQGAAAGLDVGGRTTLSNTMIHDNAGSGIRASAAELDLDVVELTGNKVGLELTDTPWQANTVTAASNETDCALANAALTDEGNNQDGDGSCFTVPNSAPVATNDRAGTGPGQSVVIDVLANDSDNDADPLTITSVTSTNATIADDALTLTYAAPLPFSGETFEYTVSDPNGDTATAEVTVDLVCGDVTVTAAEGGAALHAAVDSTEACPGAQTITIEPGRYVLSRGFQIKDQLTFAGTDPANPAILELRGAPTGTGYVFFVTETAGPFEARNLHIDATVPWAVGFFRTTTARLEHVSFQSMGIPVDCSFDVPSLINVLSGADLTLVSSQFLLPSCHGLFIEPWSSARIESSLIGGARGYGIDNRGAVTVVSSQLAENRLSGLRTTGTTSTTRVDGSFIWGNGGHGLEVSSYAEVTDSAIGVRPEAGVLMSAGNVGDGIASSGGLDVRNTIVAHNDEGIVRFASTGGTITDSTIRDNRSNGLRMEGSNRTTMTGTALSANNVNCDVRSTAELTDGGGNTDDDGTCGTNHAPVANEDGYRTDEDQPISVPAPGVLGNDTDADGDVLEAVLVTPPRNADFFELRADGSFDYTPAANFAGTDSFVYAATDGTFSAEVTVTILVRAINDAPTIAMGDVLTAVSGEATPIEVRVADVDADDSELYGFDTTTPAVLVEVEHGTLTATAFSGAAVAPPTGSAIAIAGEVEAINKTLATLTYTPDVGYLGEDTVTATVDDRGENGAGVTGLRATGTTTITVVERNEPPIPAPETYETDEDNGLTVAAPGVLNNDIEPEGDVMTAILVTTTSSGELTLDADGSFLYIPNDNFFGTDQFTYRVSDGVNTSSDVTVTIEVLAVDDLLEGSVDPAQVEFDEGGSTSVIVTLTDADGPVGDTTVGGRLLNPDLGDVEVTGSGATWTVTIQGEPDAFGTTTLEIGFSDDAGGALLFVPVIINPINDAPTILPIEDQFTDEDTPFAFQIAIDDAETPVDDLELTIETDPDTLAIITRTSQTPGLSVNPLPDASGETTVTVTVSDGLAEASTSFDLFIARVNDAPTLSVPGTAETVVGTPVAFDATVADVDTPVGDLLLTAAVDDPTAAEVTVGAIDASGNASITVTPTNADGPVVVTLFLRDTPGGPPVTATIVVTVTPPNRPPVAVIEGPTEVDEGSGDALLDATGSSDSDGDPLTYTFWGAFVVDNGDGTARFTGTHDDLEVSVRVRVCDPSNLCDDAVHVISVLNVAPAVTVSVDDVWVAGVEFAAEIGYSDPGAESFLLNIDWGDGSTDEASTSVSSRRFTHTYGTPGTYEISATVSDRDGGEGVATATIEIVAGGLLVNTTDDGVDMVVGDGVCFIGLFLPGTTTPACSLRAAIAEANAAPGAQTLLVPPGTYDAETAIWMSETLELVGEDAATTAIDTPLRSNSLDELSLVGVTLRDAILRPERLELQDVRVTGGVLSASALSMVDSTFDDSTADISGTTLIVASNGMASRINGTLDGASVAIIDSSFTDSIVQFGETANSLAGSTLIGGLLSLRGTSTIDNSQLVGVEGAVWSSSDVAITNSRIDQGTFGVGLRANVDISDTTLHTVDVEIWHYVTATFERSTVVDGSLTLRGDTVIEASLLDDVGLEVWGATTFRNSTVVDGSVEGTNDPLVSVESSTLLTTIEGSLDLSLQNSFVSSCEPFVFPVVAPTSADSDGSCVIGPLAGIGPSFGPLQDNGGPTHTVALLDESPLADAGADCPATDQRGEPRPFDADDDGVATCDIGAYESQSIIFPVNQPPVADLVLTPTSGVGAFTVIANAGGSTDAESPADDLQYYWNGATTPSNSPTYEVYLSGVGPREITVQVADPQGNRSEIVSATATVLEPALDDARLDITMQWAPLQPFDWESPGSTIDFTEAGVTRSIDITSISSAQQCPPGALPYECSGSTTLRATTDDEGPGKGDPPDAADKPTGYVVSAPVPANWLTVLAGDCAPSPDDSPEGWLVVEPGDHLSCEVTFVEIEEELEDQGSLVDLRQEWTGVGAVPTNAAAMVELDGVVIDYPHDCGDLGGTVSPQGCDVQVAVSPTSSVLQVEPALGWAVTFAGDCYRTGSVDDVVQAAFTMAPQTLGECVITYVWVDQTRSESVLAVEMGWMPIPGPNWETPGTSIILTELGAPQPIVVDLGQILTGSGPCPPGEAPLLCEAVVAIRATDEDSKESTGYAVEVPVAEGWSTFLAGDCAPPVDAAATGWFNVAAGEVVSCKVTFVETGDEGDGQGSLVTIVQQWEDHGGTSDGAPGGAVVELDGDEVDFLDVVCGGPASAETAGIPCELAVYVNPSTAVLSIEPSPGWFSTLSGACDQTGTDGDAVIASFTVTAGSLGEVCTITHTWVGGGGAGDALLTLDMFWVPLSDLGLATAGSTIELHNRGEVITIDINTIESPNIGCPPNGVPYTCSGTVTIPETALLGPYTAIVPAADNWVTVLEGDCAPTADLDETSPGWFAVEAGDVLTCRVIYLERPAEVGDFASWAEFTLRYFENGEPAFPPGDEPELVLGPAPGVQVPFDCENRQVCTTVEAVVDADFTLEVPEGWTVIIGGDCAPTDADDNELFGEFINYRSYGRYRCSIDLLYEEPPPRPPLIPSLHVDPAEGDAPLVVELDASSSSPAGNITSYVFRVERQDAPAPVITLTQAGPIAEITIPETDPLAYWHATVTVTDNRAREATSLPRDILIGTAGRCVAQTQIPVAQCVALVDLYEATDGANWEFRHWTSLHPCTWHGVNCLGLGGLNDVISLHLDGNGLTGTLPDSIGDLPLAALDLSNNHLSGSVPDSITTLNISPDFADLDLSGQSGCLTATDSTASWLFDRDPRWNDGCWADDAAVITISVGLIGPYGVDFEFDNRVDVAAAPGAEGTVAMIDALAPDVVSDLFADPSDCAGTIDDANADRPTCTAQYIVVPDTPDAVVPIEITADGDFDFYYWVYGPGCGDGTFDVEAGDVLNCTIYFVRDDGETGSGLADEIGLVVVEKQWFGFGPVEEANAFLWATNVTSDDSWLQRTNRLLTEDGVECNPQLVDTCDVFFLVEVSDGGDPIEISEDPLDGWHASYGGDCDAAGVLAPVRPHQVRHCTVSNVQADGPTGTIIEWRVDPTTALWADLPRPDAVAIFEDGPIAVESFIGAASQAPGQTVNADCEQGAPHICRAPVDLAAPGQYSVEVFVDDLWTAELAGDCAGGTIDVTADELQVCVVEVVADLGSDFVGFSLIGDEVTETDDPWRGLVTYQIVFEQPTPAGTVIDYVLFPNGAQSYFGLQLELDGMSPSGSLTMPTGTEVYEFDVRFRNDGRPRPTVEMGLSVRNQDGAGLVVDALIHDDDASPSAEIEATPQEASTGTNVQLSAVDVEDADGEVVEYQWYFERTDEVRTTIVPSFSQWFGAPGLHTVALIVTDDEGNRSTNWDNAPRIDIEIADGRYRVEPEAVTERDPGAPVHRPFMLNLLTDTVETLTLDVEPVATNVYPGPTIGASCIDDVDLAVDAVFLAEPGEQTLPIVLCADQEVEPESAVIVRLRSEDGTLAALTEIDVVDDDLVTVIGSRTVVEGDVEFGLGGAVTPRSNSYQYEFYTAPGGPEGTFSARSTGSPQTVFSCPDGQITFEQSDFYVNGSVRGGTATVRTCADAVDEPDRQFELYYRTSDGREDRFPITWLDDDPVPAIDVSPIEFTEPAYNEPDTTRTISVALDEPLEDDLFYEVTTVPVTGGASIGIVGGVCDLQPVDDGRRALAGATELIVNVDICADRGIDPDGRFLLRFTPAGHPDDVLADVPVDILDFLDEDDLPIVTPVSEVVQVGEADGLAIVTFIVETEYSGALFASTAGTGSASTPSILGPGDYLPFDAQPAVLESGGLSGGTAIVTVEVAILDDALFEDETAEVAADGGSFARGHEKFNIEIWTLPTGGDKVATVIVEIIDDDTPPVVEVVPRSIDEGDPTGVGPADFDTWGSVEVIVVEPPDRPYSLELRSESGPSVDFGLIGCPPIPGTELADAPGFSETITVLPSQAGETLSVDAVLACADGQDEPDASYAVSARSESGALLHSATITIVDDDGVASSDARVSISNASVFEGNDGTKTVTVDVEVAADTIPLSIDWETASAPPGTTSATAGVDYLAASGSLFFGPPGGTQTITLTVFGDEIIEGDEWFRVRLTDDQGVRLSDEAQVRIRDDEFIDIEVLDAEPVYEGHSGTRAMRFTITASAEPPEDAIFIVRSHDGASPVLYPADPNLATVGSDHNARATNVTFGPGRPLSQEVTVSIRGDEEIETTEAVFLVITGFTGGGSSTTAIAQGYGIGFILDDDEPPTISGPDAMQAEIVQPAESTPVFFPVTARDSQFNDLAVTCSPASGTVFPEGSFLIQCEAVDEFGNEASHRFELTVTEVRRSVRGRPGGDVSDDGPPITQVPQGGSMQTQADGYEAGSTVRMELRSDPISLGSVVADAAGSVATTITIPADAPVGRHTLAFMGEAPDGSVRHVLVPIEVMPRRPAAVRPSLSGVEPLSDVVVPAPAASAIETVGATPDQDGTPLAHTGAAATHLLRLALLAIGTGLALVGVSRRRLE